MPASRRRVQLVDGAAAGLAALLLALVLPTVGVDPVATAVGMAVALPLAWRRTAPLLAATVVGLVALAFVVAQVVLGAGLDSSVRLARAPWLPLMVVVFAVVCVVVHCVTVYRSRLASLVVGAAAFLGVGLELLVLGLALPLPDRVLALTFIGVSACVPLALAWGLGAMRLSLRGVRLDEVAGRPARPAEPGVQHDGGPAASDLGRRIDAWLRLHQVAVDRGVALGLAALSGLEGGATRGSAWGFVAGFLLVAPLAWRRSAPVRAMAATAVVATALWLTDATTVIGELRRGVSAGVIPTPPTPLVGVLAVFAVVYSVSAYASRRASLVALTLGLVGAFLQSVMMTATTVAAGDGIVLVYVLGFAATGVLTAWAFGTLRHARAGTLEDLRERARLLEIERDQQARLSASAERARIAREMHDVVAHSLAVVIAQADGGRYAARTRPEAAEGVLETIGQTARQALAEMRQLLGVLRESPSPSGAPAPQPAVEDLAPLVERVAAGGLPVQLEVEGTPRPLPPGISLAAYRIVQEALTNVLKHGGSAATARVRVRWTPGAVELLVEDDGRGAAALPPEPGGGNGIVGMRERAALYGGRVDAAPRPGGGFVVRALLPLPAVPDNRLVEA